NEERDWIFKDERLQFKVVRFLKKLYGEVLLRKAISNEEIKATMFDMAPLKAPNSD
ncbi:hypothetical protein J1N35_043143, partial [Gossypium stocksii]